MKRCGILSLSLILACRSAPVASPTRPPTIVADAATDATEPLRIAATFEATSRGRRFTLREGQTLHTGDRLAIHLTASTTAYVYVVQRDPRGEPTLVYPAPGQTIQVHPGEMIRLPSGRRAFELDDAIGDERVVVIASRRPLAQSDPALEQIVDDLSEIREPNLEPEPGDAALSMRADASLEGSDATARVASATPPRESSGRTARHQQVRARLAEPRIRELERGLRVTNEDDDVSFVGRADEAGVVAVAFMFHHEP